MSEDEEVQQNTSGKPANEKAVNWTEKESESKSLLSLFRRRILIMALLSFALTVGLFFHVQNVMAKKDAEAILELNMSDLRTKIEDYADNKLLTTAENVKFYLDYKEKNFGNEFLLALRKTFAASNDDVAFMKFMASKFSITDALIVDDSGIILCSSDESQIGFDMTSGEQSSEFMALLDDETEMVQSYQPMSKDSAQWRKFAGAKLKNGGFVQVSYGPDEFHKVMDDMIRSITENRRIGETGFIVVFDENGFAISAADKGITGDNITKFGSSIEELDSFCTGNIDQIQIESRKYDCLGEKIEGFYVLTILPKSEAKVNRTSNTIIAASAVFLTVVSVFLVIYALIKGTIINNLKKITIGLNDIANGDLNVVLDVRGNSEFESLSRNINTTVTALKNYRDAETKKIEDELEYAKNIQQGALISVFPPYPNNTEFDIYATMAPAKEVGGDFYDFELLNGKCLTFLVADVSGKGIPAALFMMRAKSFIRSLDHTGMSIDEIMYRVNNELCTNNDAGLFVTCWLGMLDIETGVVEYSNAGHNPPVIIRKDGTCSYLKNKPGLVLAGMENIKYSKFITKLEPGDAIFVYSDGVTEATNENNELFGEERLLDALAELKDESVENQCKLLREHIDLFVGNAPQFDDMTMLSLLYKGSDNILTVEAKLENYDKIMDFIDAKLEEAGCSPKDILKINVACDEVIANITSYAYGTGSGNMSVHVVDVNSPRGVEITFSDNGIHFNPLAIKDPDLDEPAEKRKIGGLGIYMIKNTMDKVEYDYDYINNSNNLRITKYF